MLRALKKSNAVVGKRAQKLVRGSISMLVNTPMNISTPSYFKIDGQPLMFFDEIKLFLIIRMAEVTLIVALTRY